MKIDWTLTSNNEKIINLENVLCEYAENEYLKFLEDDVTNLIDFKNNVYNRVAKDYNMEIDFNNNICSFTFATGESCSLDIESELEIIDNLIKLRYKLDDDEKIIKILLKG